MYNVPENRFGIFASSIELSNEDFQRLLDGPIAACEEALREDMGKVVNFAAIVQ